MLFRKGFARVATTETTTAADRKKIINNFFCICLIQKKFQKRLKAAEVITIYVKVARYIGDYHSWVQRVCHHIRSLFLIDIGYRLILVHFKFCSLMIFHNIKEKFAGT